ncbi:hypothetical protein V6C53_07540 [Desulfocurvibacter africanus]|uniref:hypothetical protein n=1 Tax=Desulfocurvibacter africanus TaxID=873 RepID=UPI0004277486|nr:hypothetical protein [Desulfocurvibacter africanus]
MFLLKITGALLLLYIAVSVLMYAADYFAGRRSLEGIRIEIRRKLRRAMWVYLGLTAIAFIWNLLMREGRS